MDSKGDNDVNGFKKYLPKEKSSNRAYNSRKSNKGSFHNDEDDEFIKFLTEVAMAIDQEITFFRAITAKESTFKKFLLYSVAKMTSTRFEKTASKVSDVSNYTHDIQMLHYYCMFKSHLYNAVSLHYSAICYKSDAEEVKATARKTNRILEKSEQDHVAKLYGSYNVLSKLAHECNLC